MITVQEAALESTFQKIARVIARRYGIDVRIRGGRAYVDLKVKPPCIVLPSCAPGKDVPLEVMDGFLDHETAHVIFTDRDIANGVEKGTVFDLWNNMEDVWIERSMGDRYYGCHQNLEKLNVWLYAKCEERWESSDALSRLVYALERCYRGDHEKERYAADPLIGAIIQQLQDEIDRGRVCSSTREALAIAQSILDKIGSLAKGEPDAQSGSGNSVDRDDDGGDHASPVSDNLGGEGDSGKSADETIDGDGSVNAQSSEENGQADKKGEESTQEAGNEAGEGPVNVETQTDEEKALAQEQARDFMEQQRIGAFDKPLDVEGLVNEQITQFQDWSTENDPDQYVVFSEEYDVETTWDMKKRVVLSREYNLIRQEVKKYVGNLSNILELTLNAEAEDRWVGGERRGT
jgi:hypothetical protein